VHADLSPPVLNIIHRLLVSVLVPVGGQLIFRAFIRVVLSVLSAVIMGDALTVTPVPANYPLVITVCLSLLGTTVLTWCLGILFAISPY